MTESLKLPVEMREKSDEITHLIEKIETLEEGQMINIIYYMWFYYDNYLDLRVSKDEMQSYKKVAITTRRGNLLLNLVNIIIYYA